MVATSAHAQTRPEALIGETVGDRFDLLAFAAAGGMGRVYRALDRGSGAFVAVKLLPLEASPTRFVREASALAAIHHPGVVRYLAHGMTNGGLGWLAMEWLTGEDLAQRLGEGPLDVEETLILARRAAEALSAAHARGVVHRDLKPANLFLEGGRIDALKLLDFGLARHTQDEEAEGVVGTPEYMAPEQVRGTRVDVRADVYGLGAVVYRCLAGRPPFQGTHPLAVLAKVLIETPRALRDQRPEIPAELESLTLRMLAKDPAQRPASGAAVAHELRAIEASSAPSTRRVSAAITAREQRVACVVLCAGTTPHEETIDEVRSGATEELIHRAVEQRGGRLDALARGAWLVTVPGAASPGEQATRAAKCALAVAALRPEAPLFVATGKVLVSGDEHVGEVIDRAAEALVVARREGIRGGVHVDPATAELLEARFGLEGTGAWRRLRGELDSVAPVRTLLGKPSLLVGREQPMALLRATIEACAGEPRASAVLVSAAPGLGKTRLLHELSLTALGTGDVEVHTAGGDPIRASSPFGLAAEILRRAAGIAEGHSAEDGAGKLAALVARDFAGEDARRIAEMLGEVAGVAPLAAPSPGLRAARTDVSIMADAVREAWIDWLRARTQRGFVALLLEDLHWADAASVKLVEEAFAALAFRPLLVVATTRPDPAGGFSPRFRERGLVEIALSPLSPAASRRLARLALGPSVDDAIVASITRRAAGHPFHLEELVRAVASGRGEDALPDSVLGMVQARLDALGAESRRVLRAASVFGETFWSGGVGALLGDDVAPGELRAELARLVDEELATLERAPRPRGETEYRFRHALFRDCAYATLADSDRKRAHRRAAAWLERTGENDPAVLADHYERGGAAEHALGYFRRAARQALQRNDFERATHHVSRARALGPDRATDAALRAMESEVAFWRGDFGGAASLASDAAGSLDGAAPEWFDAAAVAIGALGQAGRNDEVAAWLARAASAASPPEGRGAHELAHARGTTQLLWAHHAADFARASAALDALAAAEAERDPFLAGWVHRVRGESAWVHARDLDACLRELDASCVAFDEARATRPACLVRMNAASLGAWSGDTGRSLALVDQARALAEKLGAGFLVRYGRAVEGLTRAFAGDAQAEPMMRQALGDLQGSPRLTFVCRFVLGYGALDRGDLAEAEVQAHEARAIPVADELAAGGLALAAQVALARGRVNEAVALAAEGERIEASRPDLELTHGLASAALTEALLARGDRDAARDAIAILVGRLATIARTLQGDARRERFWSRRLPNDRVRALARELGVWREE